MNMQTFSLGNISFEAFGTVVYKKESNYIRAWLGNASMPNRNFKINDIVYTVPESGSTYVDFSDIVRSQNSGSVTVAVRIDIQTFTFPWDWVSLNGISPYKNIIPPAKMIVCENLANQIPVTFNIVEDGFFLDSVLSGGGEIQNNIPLQYFFSLGSSLKYRILDNNDEIFWQSRISKNPCNCENMAYLEWESEVGTKKGWFFEILDTQKKTINSISLQKISNDFDVRKGYELYFRLQTDKFNFQEREYFSDIVISDNIKFKIDGLESEATCVDSAFTNRNDNEHSSLIFNIKVKKYGAI
jgi:hypothetical protein